jgi:formyltetrahydrofolate deformylase
MNNAILLISCPDRRGITAAVTNFVYQNNGNIEHADQHIDAQTNTFFMRIEWALDGFRIARDAIAGKFSPIAKKFTMTWPLYFSDRLPRAAIFVSGHTHVLYDLLLRYKEKQFNCEIPLIISNRSDARHIADNFGIEYYEFAKTSKNKNSVEKKEIALLAQKGIDTIVLARYMQILSKNFVNRFPDRIINIHHSFLPAFAGANPYAQAYNRGVKIIGATSHYATPKLDAGPIIEQDTCRISHRDSIDDLKRKSMDLEKVVLARALRWHLERKILVYNNKTVVFD